MYKIISIIITLFIILYTMFVVCVPPQMHKQVMIYDSAYELVQDTKPEVETKFLPTTTNTQTTKTVKNVVANTKQDTTVSVVPQKTSNVAVQTKSSVKSVKTAPVKSTVTTHTKTQPKQVSTNTKKVQKQTTQVKKTQTTVSKKTAVTQTKSAAKQSVQTTAVQKQKEEELELIKWNKWRSDLQNQIMRDVRLPIVPQGTVFRFQFDVDKYGKVMNIQTWSTNPSFTPFAIQYIAPVIRSYQGRSILNFPQGSNRISTTVEGGWKISAQTKYSTPADFKDVEKVRN